MGVDIAAESAKQAAQVITSRRRFIAELRSTKREQGKGRFVSDDGQCYCALGVAVLSCGKEPEDYDGQMLFSFDTRVETFNRIGLDYTERTFIIELNDNQGLSFSAIADVLEERWNLK